MANASTLTLLRNTKEKAASWLTALPVAGLPLTACSVADCFWNSTETVSAGSTTYQNRLETMMPRNRYMRKEMALLCSFSSFDSWEASMSLLSSSLITLYMTGMAAITIRSEEHTSELQSQSNL